MLYKHLVGLVKENTFIHSVFPTKTWYAFPLCYVIKLIHNTESENPLLSFHYIINCEVHCTFQEGTLTNKTRANAVIPVTVTKTAKCAITT